MKVHALISLFCPITESVPTTAPPLRDVARPGSIPSPIKEEGFIQQLGCPIKRALIHMMCKQAIPYPLYDQYEVKTHVERSRRHLEPQHVQHASLPHHADSYYLAAAHEPYLPENLSHHDGYRRNIHLLHSLSNYFSCYYNNNNNNKAFSH
ncbi:hypothetical protein PS2_011667 [Malus domestica]